MEDQAASGLVYLLIFGILYFIPTFVAVGRHRGGGPIVINVFLGWTMLGWVGALAWAVSLDKKYPKHKPDDPDHEPVTIENVDRRR